MRALTQEDKEFLAEYNIDKYPKPSLTADMIVFTLNPKGDLCVLMIQRRESTKKKKNLYGGCWALPGGFMNINETIDEAAMRELKEETNLSDTYIARFDTDIRGTGIPLTQVGTFDWPGRDPRGHIVSVGYMAFVPLGKLQVVSAGDDAQDARLFKVKVDKDNNLTLINEETGCRPSVGELKGDDFVFGHDVEILTAYKRLKNRIDWTEDMFCFLRDKNSFTIYEAKRVLEKITGKELAASNFNRTFMQGYVKSGKVVPTGEYSTEFSHRAAALFKKVD